MNLTLSVDDQVVERARQVARAMDKSLNQLVRDYLEQLAAQDAALADCRELRELSLGSGGARRGWRFERDELHERP